MFGEGAFIENADAFRKSINKLPKPDNPEPINIKLIEKQMRFTNDDTEEIVEKQFQGEEINYFQREYAVSGWA